MIKKRGNSWWVVVYTGRDPLTGKKRQKTGTVEQAQAGTRERGQSLARRLRVQPRGRRFPPDPARRGDAALPVAPPTLVGYLTAGCHSGVAAGLLRCAQPAVPHPAPAADSAADAEQRQQVGEEPSKRERARQAYAALVAAGQPVTGARLAEAARVSPSYGRALLAEFQADPTLAGAHANGQRPAAEVGSGDRHHLADLPQLRRRL